jgi:hypothetical protein
MTHEPESFNGRTAARCAARRRSILRTEFGGTNVTRNENDSRDEIVIASSTLKDLDARPASPGCRRPTQLKFAYGCVLFFLTAGLAGFPFSPPLALNNARESLALNGYRRTDC